MIFAGTLLLLLTQLECLASYDPGWTAAPTKKGATPSPVVPETAPPIYNGTFAPTFYSSDEADKLDSFFCLDVSQTLCLGISTSVDPVYNPSGLYNLQLKLRTANELKGTDYLKMRWNVDRINGRIQMTNFSSLCVSKYDSSSAVPGAAVLRPCGTTGALETFDLTDFLTNVDELGVIALASNPTQCLTVMACNRLTSEFCNPDSTTIYTSSTFNPDAQRGSYVKFMPCIAKGSPGYESQYWRQALDCAPGCSPYDLATSPKDPCNPACANAACNWDRGACATPNPTPPTFRPSYSPSTHPTTSTPSARPSRGPSKAPTIKPSKSPSTTRPSKSPTNYPSLVPTVSPTTKPSQSPTPRPVVKLGAVDTQSPTSSGPPGFLWFWIWLGILLFLILLVILSACCYACCYRRRRDREAAKKKKEQEQKEKEIDLEQGTKNASWKSLPGTPSSKQTIMPDPSAVPQTTAIVDPAAADNETFVTVPVDEESGNNNPIAEEEKQPEENDDEEEDFRRGAPGMLWAGSLIEEPTTPAEKANRKSMRRQSDRFAKDHLQDALNQRSFTMPPDFFRSPHYA